MAINHVELKTKLSIKPQKDIAAAEDELNKILLLTNTIHGFVNNTVSFASSTVPQS
jgi:hypothetical protein